MQLVGCSKQGRKLEHTRERRDSGDRDRVGDRCRDDGRGLRGACLGDSLNAEGSGGEDGNDGGLGEHF